MRAHLLNNNKFERFRKLILRSNLPLGAYFADKAASAFAHCCNEPRFASTSTAFSRGCCISC